MLFSKMTEEEILKTILSAYEKVTSDYQTIDVKIHSFNETYPPNKTRTITIGEEGNSLRIFSGIALNRYIFLLTRKFHNKENEMNIKFSYGESADTYLHEHSPEDLEKRILSGFQYIENFLNGEGKEILEAIEIKIARLNKNNCRFFKYKHELRISKYENEMNLEIGSFKEILSTEILEKEFTKFLSNYEYYYFRKKNTEGWKMRKDSNISMEYDEKGVPKMKEHLERIEEDFKKYEMVTQSKLDLYSYIV